MSDTATYNGLLRSFGLQITSGIYGNPPNHELPVDRIHVSITGPERSYLDTYMISRGDLPEEVLQSVFEFVEKYPFSTDVNREISYIVCKGSPIVSWRLVPKKDEDVEAIHSMLFPTRKQGVN